METIVGVRAFQQPWTFHEFVSCTFVAQALLQGQISSSGAMASQQRSLDIGIEFANIHSSRAYINVLNLRNEK